MFCPYCGTEGLPDASFCAGCGKPLPKASGAAAAPQAPEQPQSGSPAPTQRLELPRAVPPPQGPPRRRSSALSYFLGVAGLVALLVAAGIFILPNFVAPGSSGTPTAAAPAAARAPTPTPGLPDLGPGARVLFTNFAPASAPVLPEDALAGGKAARADGLYCLTATQAPQPAVAAVRFPYGGFVLEAAAAFTSGARSKAMGLVLRGADDKGAGALYFEIGDDEVWKLLSRAADGSLKTVAGPKRLAQTAAGKKVVHRLGVIARGQNAAFYVDGDEVHKVANAPAGEFLGLYAVAAASGKEAQGCFDDFRVEELPDKPADDRQRVQSAFGKPQAFSLAFVPGTGGATIRSEEWHYFSHLSTFTFEDGRLVYNEQIPLPRERRGALQPGRGCGQGGSGAP